MREGGKLRRHIHTTQEETIHYSDPPQVGSLFFTGLELESNVTNLMFMHQIAGLYQTTAYFWAALFSSRESKGLFS
jgi:hypothetical protein